MKSIFILLLTASIIACNSGQPKQTTDNADSKKESKNTFDTFKNNFVDSLWVMEPVRASFVGYHRYDSLLPAPTEIEREKKLAFVDRKLKALKSFELAALNTLNQIDYKMISDALENMRFKIDTFKSYQWNPSQYNLGGAFFQVINYRKKPLEWRMKQLNKKLKKVPDYYAAAQNQTVKPTKVHTILAIEQLKGSKSVFKKTLIDSLKKTNLNKTFKSRFKENIARAVKSIDGFVNYLEKDMLPEVADDSSSFRIGKKLFEEKFKHEIHAAHSAKEIFEAAVAEKGKLHDRMYRLSDMLWEKYFGSKAKPGNRLTQIKMVIDTISYRHVHRDSLVDAIRRQIPELEAFVKKHKLLTLDPEKPLVVRETPMYMRGVAGASISAPGPYDKNAETYYNVTPLDDYSDEEAESYLREYNYYVLQILNIHEAIPGHYTQLVYSNESPSIIKSVFGNGAMIEGWAVYAEKMMMENNYGGAAMEMGLMYYKWNLRTVCNAILDYGVHVLDFSKKDAMQLLRREAFQQKAEAEGKWRRARLSQVQLSSYFTGYYEILALREEMRKSNPNFDLRDFHETFLSYGSIPVKYIKEIMEKEGGKLQ